MDKQSLWPLPLLKRRAQYCVCTTVYNVVHCTCYSHSNVLLTQYRILTSMIKSVLVASKCGAQRCGESGGSHTRPRNPSDPCTVTPP